MNTHPSFAPRARVWPTAGIAFTLLLAVAATESHAATSSPTPLTHCGSDLDHSSTSIVDHDGEQSWTIKAKSDRCSIDFRLEGKVTFNDDFTDVASMERGARLRADVFDDGTRRRLEIEPGRDGLVRTWSVDGRDRPYDAEARAWLAAFLIELDRRTAVGVDKRLPVLLKKGGVTAVLDETAHMPADYARGVYYSKLAAATSLSSHDLVRVFDQAASLKTSDYYGSELMKSMGARSGSDPEVRAAMLRLVGAMSSDYYRVESVRQAVGSRKLGPREMDILIGVLPHVDSGYYKTELLKTILASGSLDGAQRAKLAAFARDIDEDAYTSEFVRALAVKGDAGPGGARALIDAASTIGGDYHRSEALTAILQHQTLAEADLLAMVKAASSASEYYRAEMLRGIVKHPAATDAVRRASLAATGGMSAYYRKEVEKATGSR
jgi:hypothetical protein